MINRFDRLLAKAVKLGNSFPIMPIDEIRIAVDFSELPDQERVVSRLVDELFDHENMHVRRIAINACRRSGHFEVRGLQEAITRKLLDLEAWVRYDAAWTVLVANYDSEKIRNYLAELSSGIELITDEERIRQNPSDAELQARVRAKQTLVSLQSRMV